jgi:putative ABC transport system ATP-binding protein
MESAVVCKGVKKHFGKGDAQVMALDGIDLEVRSGELMLLVGPSGSGKTTLLSVIAGILRRDAGECTVYGQDLEQLAPRAQAHYRGDNIGFVFQSYHLIPTLSIVENVAIPLMIRGGHRSQALRQAAVVLTDVGLGDRLKAFPRELSGGMQQRTAVCRALVHEPQLIVCDEPTSALDHVTGGKVMELLKERGTGNGKTLIVVTHDTRIFGFADRIAEMDDGRIVKLHDSPEEMID